MIKYLTHFFKTLQNRFWGNTIPPYLTPSKGEELAHAVLSFFSMANKQASRPGHTTETISHYRFLFPKLDIKNFNNFLSLLANQYSLRLLTICKSLKEIQSFVTPDSPFLLLVGNEDNLEIETYAIVSYRSSTYKILRIGKVQNEYWIPEKELLTLLGTRTNSDKLNWIISEPLYAFSEDSEEKNSFSKLTQAYNQLIHLMRLERRDIWIIIIYGIGIGLLSLVIPIATSTLINIVSFGVLLQPVLVLTLLVVFFLGFAGAMQVVQTYVVEVLQRRVFVRIATEFAAKFPKIKQESLDSFHKPELANRFFDTMTIQKAINTLLVDGLSVVLTAFVGFILIGIYHPIFLMFDIIIIFITCYLIVYKLGGPASQNYLKVSKEKYKVAAWIEEISRHTAVFHSKFGAKFALEKVDALTCDYIYSREKYFKYLLRQIIGLVILQTIASGVVLGIGGYLVIHRQLTIGQLVAAELVIAKVLSDISRFGKHLNVFYSLLAAIDKIGTVLDLPLIKVGNTPYIPTNKPTEIEVSNLSYSLANGHLVFSEMNMVLASGTATGVTVKNPYEANIFLDLISAIRVPNAGIISYDKQDIHETDYHQNHDHSFLIRGNEIFEGSILDNLRMGREEISLIDIRETLVRLKFWDFVQQMPQGIHTELLTFGHPFDSFQTSVLQIARAVLGKPRLLMIDGLLDTLPEIYLQPALELLLSKDRHWTLLIVSSSMDIIPRLDQVLHLENIPYLLKSNRKRGNLV